MKKPHEPIPNSKMFRAKCQCCGEAMRVLDRYETILVCLDCSRSFGADDFKHDAGGGQRVIRSTKAFS